MALSTFLLLRFFTAVVVFLLVPEVFHLSVLRDKYDADGLRRRKFIHCDDGFTNRRDPSMFVPWCFGVRYCCCCGF